MMYEFERLARYNAERARGIVHTPEYEAEMAAEQDRFHEDMHQRKIEQGWIEVAPGTWMKPAEPKKKRWWQR